MAGLSVTEIVDLSILFVAAAETPPRDALTRRIGALTGGGFVPADEVVAGRVAALELAGFLAAPAQGAGRDRLGASAEGREYAHALTSKVTPRACSARLLGHALGLALDGHLTADSRAALILQLAHRDAALPAMTATARDLAAARAGCAP